MSIVTTAGKQQILSLLSLPNDIFDKSLSYFSEKLKDRDYNSLYSESEIKKAGFYDDGKKIVEAFVALYNISKFSVKEEHMNSFIADLKDMDFNDLQLNKIREIIDKMKKYHLVDEIIHFDKLKELENLGLPSLTNIHLFTNYRVLTNPREEKELIPVIQCNIVINNEYSNESKSIDFQFTPRELNTLINYFEEFRKNYLKNNEFILSKIKPLGG